MPNDPNGATGEAMPSTDPLLALINAFREGIAAYNSRCSSTLSKTENDALVASTYEPHLNCLCSNPPSATTLAGAVEAFRLVLHEEEEVGHSERLTVNVLKAGLAFFDDQRPVAPDPCLALLNDWQAAVDAAEALPDSLTDEELEEFRNTHIVPIERQIVNAELPTPTTAEGAATALRKALAFDEMENLETGLVKAALAFLEGSAGH